MKIKSIKQAKNLAGKFVLLRVDFNVPIEKGKVTEEYKLLRSLPTINYLLRQRAKLIIITHLGRPEFTKAGKVKNHKDYSTKVLANRLKLILHKKVNWVDQVVGDKVKEKVSSLKEGDVLLLENLRFEPGEKKNSKTFAKQLASLADVYVNDAFSVCHREHASVVAVKKYLPSYAGLLLEREINNLQQVLQPRKDLVVIIGGAKMKTKVAAIRKLSKIADKILLGGAVANTFLAAQKLPIGKSLVDKKYIKLAKRLMNKKIILPSDVVVAQTKKYKRVKVKAVEEVGATDMILDIGPETMKEYARYIKQAKTIVWNGPMGLFETPPFHHGTMFIGRIMASRSSNKAFGLAGGGETVAALRQTKMFDEIDWISTGGGAILTYLGRGAMPGLKKIIK